MVAPHTPTPLSMPTQNLKRPYSFEGLYSTGGGSAREIRPRPTPSINTNYAQPTSEPPAKKKRGRPTKAEQAAKEEAKAAAAAATAAASGESASAPMSRPTTQTPVPTQPPVVTAPPQAEEIKPALAVAARMPIAAMLTPTARDPKSASNSSSSSSGKRRRARSNRSEAEGGGNVYDSPYGRVVSAADDSPARTAVLRHREEALMSAPRIDQQAPSGGAAPHHADPGPPH